MARKALLAFICYLLIALTSCSDNPTMPPPVGLNQSLTVHEGETIQVTEGLAITFVEVSSDGRCPQGPTVYCFWQGLASAEFQLLQPCQDPVIVTAPILGFVTAADSTGHLPVNAGKYTITLQQLDPYPTLQVQPHVDHTATILVEEIVLDEPTVPPVQISDISPDEIQIAPFVLDSVAIVADTINLKVHHSGGCQDHYFFLYMSPAAFMESYPVQANIYLRHIDNGDMCEAWLSADLKFNLRPIAELYQACYGGLDLIRLNVHEFTGSDSARVVTAIYNPAE